MGPAPLGPFPAAAEGELGAAEAAAVGEGGENLLSLEWLRQASDEEAKAYLLGIDGAHLIPRSSPAVRVLFRSSAGF